MKHRGPDDEGLWTTRFGKSELMLVQTRLSILDLSPLGHQPLETPDGSAVLAYNGEIYNYMVLRRELERRGVSFRGHSDTEVLLWGLRLNGKEFVKRLEGMYAFAYFDRNANSLLLARDPAGIKPLYFVHKMNRFAFASEFNALLETNLPERIIDREAVGSYFAYGAIAQPHTLFRDIKMLEPGSTLQVDGTEDGLSVHQSERWWRMPQVCREEVSLSQAIARTKELVEESVRDHLMADVPVGVFLSAGIDSTLISSVARKYSDSIRAFTIDLEGTGASDEGEIASETARQIGIDHSLIRVSDEQAKVWMTEWLDATDAPSIDGLNTFIISKAVRSQEVKVALSGLGADELFGGYSTFRDVPKIAKLVQSLQIVPKFLRRILANGIAFRQSSEGRMKLLDMVSTNGSVPLLALMRRRLFTNEQLSSVGLGSSELLENGYLSDGSFSIRATSKSSPGWDISFSEFSNYQQNMLLRDSDANSMAHSLEIRVPFLDQRLLNWVPTLPDLIRFPTGQPGKYLLREAFKDQLSSLHLRRPKTGFTIPFTKWMHGPLRDACESKVSILKRSEILEERGIEAVWNHFIRNPSLGSSTRALALVSLGAALERFQSKPASLRS